MFMLNNYILFNNYFYKIYNYFKVLYFIKNTAVTMKVRTSVIGITYHILSLTNIKGITNIKIPLIIPPLILQL